MTFSLRGGPEQLQLPTSVQITHSKVSAPSKCVSIIEFVEDKEGQAWTAPAITTCSDVYPDNVSKLLLKKLTLYFAHEMTFFFFFFPLWLTMTTRKSSASCSSLWLKMSQSIINLNDTNAGEYLGLQADGNLSYFERQGTLWKGNLPLAFSCCQQQLIIKFESISP